MYHYQRKPKFEIHCLWKCFNKNHYFDIKFLIPFFNKCFFSDELVKINVVCFITPYIDLLTPYIHYICYLHMMLVKNICLTIFSKEIINYHT